MTDLKTLEKKVNQLEKRLKKIEDTLSPSPTDTVDRAWMETLYAKAKQLVITQNKASAIFLQRKLLIDYERASKLMRRLQKEGIIGSARGAKPRKILTNK